MGRCGCEMMIECEISSNSLLSPLKAPEGREVMKLWSSLMNEEMNIIEKGEMCIIEKRGLLNEKGERERSEFSEI